MKQCAVCGEFKPRNSAHFHIRKNGYRRECISCRSAKDKARYGGLSSYQKLAMRLRSKYGITPKDYQLMLKAQGGRCGICQRAQEERRLVVDHCHKTLEVRGLLCDQCNTAIGLLSGDASNQHLFAAAAWCDKTQPNDAQRHLRQTAADPGRVPRKGPQVKCAHGSSTAPKGRSGKA